MWPVRGFYFTRFWTDKSSAGIVKEDQQAAGKLETKKVQSSQTKNKFLSQEPTGCYQRWAYTCYCVWVQSFSKCSKTFLALYCTSLKCVVMPVYTFTFTSPLLELLSKNGKHNIIYILWQSFSIHCVSSLSHLFWFPGTAAKCYCFQDRGYQQPATLSRLRALWLVGESCSHGLELVSMGSSHEILRMLEGLGWGLM